MVVYNYAAYALRAAEYPSLLEADSTANAKCIIYYMHTSADWKPAMNDIPILWGIVLFALVFGTYYLIERCRK